ncbi:MAG TPA: hypothetical protein VIX37_05735, partial [Candidatus Sulfotelmatobacter sp.]
MKSVFGKFALIALSVLTVGECSGHAQIMNELRFKVSQPFTVANTTLEAGSYVIRPVPEAGLTVLEISSASGKPTVMVDVESVQP